MPSNLRRYDEPGHIHFLTLSCYLRLTFFHNDALKQVAIDGLHKTRAKHNICLIGYVIMPDHVHLILYPHKRCDPMPIPISIIIKSFKQHVGFHGRQRLLELQEKYGKLWSPAVDDWSRSQPPKSIWMKRGYDFNITRQETLHEKLNYCHRNPITANLVPSAADWKWSSYRFYEHDDRSVVSMDWDGAWPIEW